MIQTSSFLCPSNSAGKKKASSFYFVEEPSVQLSGLMFAPFTTTGRKKTKNKTRLSPHMVTTRFAVAEVVSSTPQTPPDDCVGFVKCCKKKKRKGNRDRFSQKFVKPSSWILCGLIKAKVEIQRDIFTLSEDKPQRDMCAVFFSAVAALSYVWV